MAALPADDGEAVLGKIMSDGTFDDLRQQLVVKLKENVGSFALFRLLMQTSCRAREP